MPSFESFIQPPLNPATLSFSSSFFLQRLYCFRRPCVHAGPAESVWMKTLHDPSVWLPLAVALALLPAAQLGAADDVAWKSAAGPLGAFSLLLDGDALVSPYGRAEDLLAALQYRVSERATLRLGYRVLEGGADGGGNVYTFALFNYLTAGLRVVF